MPEVLLACAIIGAPQQGCYGGVYTVPPEMLLIYSFWNGQKCILVGMVDTPQDKHPY